MHSVPVIRFKSTLGLKKDTVSKEHKNDKVEAEEHAAFFYASL